MIFLKNFTHCTHPNDAPEHSKWINILKNIVRSIEGKKVNIINSDSEPQLSSYPFPQSMVLISIIFTIIMIHRWRKLPKSRYIQIRNTELIKLAKFNFPSKKSELIFSLYPDFNGIFNVFFQSQKQPRRMTQTKMKKLGK